MRGAGLAVALCALAMLPAHASAQSPPAWFPAASMVTARQSPTVTTLANGKVLVTGGFNPSGPVASAELYDPNAHTWSSAGRTLIARDGSTATLLPDGRVLVAGGSSGISLNYASAELYDPVSNTWSFTASMSEARSFHTATLLSNGKVLVAGGASAGVPTAKAELYDPASNSWSATGSLSEPREYHTATRLPSGKVLVVGGFDGLDPTGSAVLYDAATGTWSPAGGISPGRGHAATLLADGRVLVTGGYSIGPYANADVYDAATNVWSAAANMHVARYWHTAARLPSGQVLVAGGVNAPAMQSAELYDPVSDTWSTTTSLTAGRGLHAAALLETGYVLVTGGRDAAGTELASAAEYGVDSTPPAPVGLAEVDPPSPANDNSPVVKGSAEPGSTVRIYATADCSGPPIGEGAAADLASPGLAATVPDDSSTTFHATSTDEFANTSPCSVASLTYVEDSTAPETTVDSGPPAISGDAVSIAFGASEPGSVECRLDGAAFAACTSPTAYAALPDGVHSFVARAVDAAGNVDASPARHVWAVDTAPPLARFTAAPNPALAGRTVTFDAGGSFDAGSGIARYEWDLDGDGTFEQDTGATPSAARSYPDVGTYGVQLRVTDRAGRAGVARSDQRITTDDRVARRLAISINAGARFTNDPEVTIKASWPSFASLMLISNDGGFEQARAFPLGVLTRWTLDSSGAERLPKIVYVRFTRGLTVSETYIDDIILDQSAPSVTSARVTPSKGGGAAPLLRVTARDRGPSGVGSVQVTNNRRDPKAKFRARRATIKLTTGRGERRLSLRKAIYVRVRDRAGNLSAWRVARLAHRSRRA